MKNIYIGPLWGNVCRELLTLKELQGAQAHFFGGYNFFGTDGLKVVDWLNTHKSEIELKFNKSRFENYFLVTCNLSNEKNYNFRRWINPLSGIVSAVQSYGIEASDFFDDPENIYNALLKKIDEVGHLPFYQKLENQLFPKVVEDLIEQSIETRDAFKVLKIYDEQGEVIYSLEFQNDFLKAYLEKTLDLIERYAHTPSASHTASTTV